MTNNYFKSSLLLSFLAMFVFTCNTGSTNSDEKTGDSLSASNQVSAPEVSAICLWSSVSLRETPQQKGKYINTIYMGEKAIYMGEAVMDSSDKKNPREFIKIKLTDGKVGWVQGNMMAIGGKPYALVEKTKLYKRPDILSVGKEEFDKMQFVVITEEQDEWAKIKGKKKTDGWFKEGWVKMDKLIGTEVDVTVSILAERALLIEDNEKRIEALNEILGNSDFNASIFIDDIRVLTSVPANIDQVEEVIEGD
jgi:hypothetical protein